MKELIVEKLNELAEKHGVKIIFACEAGSRAYGIDSTESDYDVKFLYVDRMDRYLSLRPHPDTITEAVPGTGSGSKSDILDMNGWELKKALTLCLKSNATLFEWLSSSIIYVQDEYFTNQLREIIHTYYSKMGLAHHWRTLADRNVRAYINVHDVKYKQYLYVIRPLLCMQWLIDNKDKSTFPSLQIDTLLNEVKLSDAVREIIQELVDKKRMGSYLGEGKHALELEKWFGYMINTAGPEYCKEKVKSSVEQNEEWAAKVDKLFYEMAIKYTCKSQHGNSPITSNLMGSLASKGGDRTG